MITTLIILGIIYVLLILKNYKSIKALLKVKDSDAIIDSTVGKIIISVLTFLYIGVITILLFIWVFKIITTYLP
jgi:uncharacterized BrkB/YihY/UPF0761 family membrane protein